MSDDDFPNWGVKRIHVIALLFASLVLTSGTYSLPEGRVLQYDMAVSLDGYLPIFGGQEAKAELALGVKVSGLTPDTDGNARASSELTAVKVTFNGAEMPFGVANVQTYFPKTTVSLSPLGKVLKTDAPTGSLPVRLPGLDIKRFPEISFLPLELPEAGLAEGKSWTFARTYNGVPMAYHAQVSGMKEGVAEVAVTVDQTATWFETASKQAASSKEGAASSVSTRLTGKGTVFFDINRGIATKIEMDLKAADEVTDLKTGAKKDRKLATKHRVVLKG